MHSYHIEDYDFAYPLENVAHEPVSPRDHSRLLVLNRNRPEEFSCHRFLDLPQFLKEGDCLVCNDVRVVPLRLNAYRRGGGISEILILADGEGNALQENQVNRISQNGKKPRFEALISRGRKIRVGTELKLKEGIYFEVLKQKDAGRWVIEFHCPSPTVDLFQEFGRMPLPPYLRTGKGENDEKIQWDRQRYQTVYAQSGVAVAAPTAGLHFSKELIEQIRQMGVEVYFLTLQVSYGTFRPIRCADFRDHEMEEETYEISETTAHAITETKKRGGRVLAVGTTVTRALESAALFHEGGAGIHPGRHSTKIFIHSDFPFKIVDGLITNFHLPRSTLLLLACAFSGRENIFRAYEHAIENGFRLFSYGDAMFIC
jgi:S-adenosylmethionine:tRNA ribosyltransferase-isomerase